MSEDERLKVTSRAKAAWQESYSKGLQHDLWGQVVEAVEAYEKTSRTIRSQVDDLEPVAEDRVSSPCFGQRQQSSHSLPQTALNKIMLSIKLRVKRLTAAKETPGPSVEQMQGIVGVFKDLFSDVVPALPFDLAEFGTVGTELHFEEEKVSARVSVCLSACAHLAHSRACCFTA